MGLLDPNRLFPAEPGLRAIAQRLYDGVRDLPIVSPHGHCDPRWFAENTRFPNPAELFVVPLKPIHVPSGAGLLRICICSAARLLRSG